MNYEDWVWQVKCAVQGASIARQVHDHIAEGKGPPTKEDMRRFFNEAGAIAELWEETCPGH